MNGNMQAGGKTANGDHRGRGFTLVELMIVVAIIGLLSAIAVPGYQDYVRKGKRTEGKAALAAAASRLERFYTQNNCYPSPATTCANATGSGLALTAAGIPTFAGDNDAKASYDISVTINPQDFTVFAAPRVGVAWGPYGDPLCGRLTLTNTNRKWTQSNGTADDAAPVAGCW